MLPEQYCLRWKHHHSNVQSMFAQLLEKERFCDVTLYCSPSFINQVEKGDNVDPETIKGVSLRAHRVVLAACSELLGSLLFAHEAQGEPVLVIDGATPRHVRALLDFMYTGEMNVHRSELGSLLKTAEELKIKGLTDLRWNNKDEPPDSRTGAVTTTETKTEASVGYREDTQIEEAGEQDVKQEKDSEKFNVNGGPPPLIKLTTKEKISPTIKREISPDVEDQNGNSKRQRLRSGMDHTDDEDKDQEWRHGNMDITAERVVQWGGSEASAGSWEPGTTQADEDDEWGEAPADIGSFLHTNLRVDGDNSGEESNEGAPPSTSSSVGATDLTAKGDLARITPVSKSSTNTMTTMNQPMKCPKSGPTDPRFTDVIKLNDYLRHGRRPQFWEEEYVKRVMEAIRLKELEMKQAAEILGVSYGTLYGRYRDAYGCINRPFRTARDFWTNKGATEILERLKRGDIPMEVAAQALGVNARDLYVHYHELLPDKGEFEPIPIEIDPSLRMKSTPTFASSVIAKSLNKKSAAAVERAVKRVLIGNINDDESIPATVISAQDCQRQAASTARSLDGRWRMNLDTRASSSSTSPAPDPGVSTSPTQLMKSRPDLTIVAAKKPETIKDEDSGT